MAEAPTTMWPGQAPKKYRYWIHPIGTPLREEPGNYIFAKETTPGRWTPCYIGHTENLNQRLGAHEEEACAKRHGSTHIHAHLTTGDESARRTEEKDLISTWKPPCNEQLV